MLSDSPQEEKYLVLNICKALRFDCLNDGVLRITTAFQNKRLTSKCIAATPKPNFDVTFIWSTTARHINILQKRCSNIEIAICASSAGKSWTAGCATIGIQHAQVLGPNVELSTQRVPIYNVKTETKMVLRPELVVTLSIRSEPPLNIDSQLHWVDLSDPSESVSPVHKMVRSYTSSATIKTKKGREVESQESVNLLSRSYLRQIQQNERNRNRLLKHKDCHSAPGYKVLIPDRKRAMNMQRSPQIITPPLPPLRTFEPLPKICWMRDQKMYKYVREPQEAKDPNENSVQMTCNSTETAQEVPKSHDCIPTLPSNMKIPSRIRLIVQNADASTTTSVGGYSSSSTSKMIDQSVKSHDCTPTLPDNMRIPSRIGLIVQYTDRSKMSSLGVYGSSSTFKMIGQPAKSRDCTPKLPNNVEIPSRIRLITQNIDKSKMASSGVHGSSSTFQMIGQPPPTRKPEVQIQKLNAHTSAPQKHLTILWRRNANSSKVNKKIDSEEEDIEI